MAYREAAETACTAVIDLTAFDDEFDPLEVDDEEIDQEEMDDDNPYDTIDYPTMRNMPETPHRSPVYSPERQGSATAALRELIRQNPNRRPVLLGIIGLCEGGCKASELAVQVNEWQKDNWSVYEPPTLCRMLETAGALTIEMPPAAEAQECVEDGVAYLRIKESVDPVWHATEEALALRKEYQAGDSFRSIVLTGDEARYASVYAKVMGMLAERPRGITEVEEVVNGIEECRKPRRFGQHFLDVLELTDCAEWKGGAWQLTELGAAMLPELRDREEV